ncbi:hypothetical protein N7495_001912 [Penicillium taxi]|uniref:uncharacterized protein n=1 Tax=Penicillium taxi TaxID=168475 RepID=UPI0025450A51|nr:uncharacterized protein N7495_001912 [Penicillium taxi]KAJ5909230.1 hypothetical protein N7495_001912 [Penicillium taxi]
MISPVRSKRSSLTFLLAIFLFLSLIYLKFRPRYFSISTYTQPTYSSCGKKIEDTDFSPSALVCRIKKAQTHAREDLRAQSTTPEEAVIEYKRRYNRDPPKGFHDWVRFSLDHDSLIIDDFDQIDRDLELYRTPEARQAFNLMNEQRENWPQTRRLTVRDGVMYGSAEYMYDDQWKSLVEPFIHALPNNSLFYMSTIDEPRILSTSGEKPSQIHFKEQSAQSIEHIVKDSCSQIPRELTSRLGHEKDVCQFSNPGELHGLIASPSSFSYSHSPAPILSFGRMSAFRDILIPCPCYVKHPLLEADSIPFLEKKPGLYWRGSSTGGNASRFNWMYGHRARFVAFIHSLQDAAKVFDVGRYFGVKSDSLDKSQITLFKDFFDVQIGAYTQCEHNGDRTTCRDMERVLGPASYEPEDTSLNYRYLFDLDGNSMSTRFYRLLSRQAVVLKQTWFQEWHDDRLVPWAHYIPVTMSMEELPALLNFLANDPVGEKLSEEISLEGYTWSRQVLREIDMSIYIYRLFLELTELYGPVEADPNGFQAVTKRIV